ncbi:hypothetical protein HXX76_013342 [Chlamydomonas incerta]|uniref:C2 domain-containing protein n=1 Tax=Chlamydomonas incerta TaxID=51695 RepID=A0A835SI42_CHLIN|nr:hypothetical protein HXX76_013342 [Chlamydomonas incerta]|eukprot:KAG2425971.1 hypothetical protein HXX76_013342 [Chlamydomonas incerta]
MSGQLVNIDLLVKGCHGLPKMDLVGHADPYFILTVTTPGGEEASEPAFRYRSHVHYNTGRPVWNEELYFTRVPVGTKVHIQVMDKDHLSAHDPVGDCELLLDADFLERAMLATASAESVAAEYEPCTPPTATPPTATPPTATPPAASPQRSRPTSSSGISRRSTGALGSDAGDGDGGAGPDGDDTLGRVSTSGAGDAASGLKQLSLGGVSTGAASSVGDALSSPPQFLGLELQMPIRAHASVRRPTAGTLSLGVGCRPCTGGPGTGPGCGTGGLLHRGPVRYRTASSWVAGKLTGHRKPDSGWRAYAAYKLGLAGLNEFFPGGAQQPWNRAYDKAQQVFNSKALRAAVHTQHNMLYADNGKQKRRGVLRGGGDLVTLLRGGVRNSSRRYYTYCINADGAMCFSETGAKFFSDFMSKHAMHADMAEAVVYAGEFTLLPPGLLPPELQQQQAGQAGGAAEAAAPPAGRIDPAEAAADAALATAAAADCCGDKAEGWTLVIDNNSGTYAPASSQLAALGGLLRFNFPGLAVAVVDSLAQKALLAALHRRVPSRCPPPAPAKK